MYHSFQEMFEQLPNLLALGDYSIDGTWYSRFERRGRGNLIDFYSDHFFPIRLAILATPEGTKAIDIRELPGVYEYVEKWCNA